MGLLSSAAGRNRRSRSHAVLQELSLRRPRGLFVCLTLVLIPVIGQFSHNRATDALAAGYKFRRTRARSPMPVRGYASTAFVCPFEGPVVPATVRQAAIALTACQEISLGIPCAAVGEGCSLPRFYFDFSGYSTMAVGLGCMFGLRIRQNFSSPQRGARVRGFLATPAHFAVDVHAGLPCTSPSALTAAGAGDVP